VFQVILCLDALIQRNSIQLLSLVVFNILSLAYVTVQIYQHIILEEEGTNDAKFQPDEKFPTREFTKDFHVKRMRPIEYVIAVLVFGFSIYLGFLSYQLMKEFGWKNYKIYTADLQVRNALISLTILQTLIKLDVFFFVSYAIQLLPSKSIGYSDSLFETFLIFIGGFLMLSIAWYSVTKEMKYILFLVINLSFISLGYIIYRIFRINFRKDGMEPYKFTKRLLTFTLSVTFILVSVSIYYAIICFKNMKRGIYVYSVYGLSGSKEGERPLAVPLDENQRESKRASRQAEVARARTFTISLD